LAAIFITYRSEDPGWSVVLDRELSAVFGPEQVFRASRTMQLGESFPERIRAGVENAKVLLAVVGPRWLEIREDGRRRIDDPDDWVRREIRIALEKGVLVVPVLVDGVNPLTAEQLPDDIRSLGERQYIRLGHSDVERDIRRLIERLRQQIPQLQPVPSSPFPMSSSPVSAALPATAEPVGPPAPRLPVLTGLVILLLAILLPWTDGTRAIAFAWDEWTFSVVLPEGTLALAVLIAALSRMTGRFVAVAMGAVAASGFLAVDIAGWWLNHVRVVQDLPNLQAGVLVHCLGGLVLLAATGWWAWQHRGRPPRHRNHRTAGAIGFVIILVAQWFQLNPDQQWFTTGHGLAVVAVVVAVLLPRSIPEPVRIAALTGFTVLAAISTLAVINYVTRFEGATLDDSPARAVLSIAVAAGVWIALGKPAVRR
jgi:hypothetical protein